MVRWLEEVAGQAGFSVDYAANFDVHSNTRLLNFYKLVACGQEFDAFQKRIFELGKHTIFFGANTAYRPPLHRSRTSLPLAEAAGARCYYLEWI